MRTYKIERASAWLNLITVFVVSFLLFIVSIIMVFLKTFDGNFYWLPPFFVFPFTVAGFITVNVFGTSNIEITVTDAGLNIEKHNRLFQNGRSVFIEWKDINSHLIRDIGVFQVFKLQTLNGRKLTITHLRYSLDDFGIFCSDFINTISKVKRTVPHAGHVIATKTIYDLPVSAYIVKMFILLMLVIPVLLWVYKPDINYFLVFFFYAYAIFFVRQYYARRQRR